MSAAVPPPRRRAGAPQHRSAAAGLRHSTGPGRRSAAVPQHGFEVASPFHRAMIQVRLTKYRDLGYAIFQVRINSRRLLAFRYALILSQPNRTGHGALGFLA